MRVVTGSVLDVCCVAVFVVIGRASHDEAGSVAGFATTAWPFLAGIAVAWVASRAWRRSAALVPTGLVVWLVTVAVGLVLRALSGQSVAVTFVVVTLVFLGVAMLGWRAIARWRTGPRARRTVT